MTWTPTAIIYHDPCKDGFTSAWIASRYYKGKDFLWLPAQYGNDFDFDVLDCHDVLMVDFSFKRPDMESLCKRANTVIVLDHHKTAEKELEGYARFSGRKVEVDAAWPPVMDNILVHFDMDHSGAMLTWRFFHGDQTPPDLVRYVEDRDLWKWELPDSKAYNSRIDVEPMTFNTWDTLHILEETISLCREGALIEAYKERKIREYLKHVHQKCFNTPEGKVWAPAVMCLPSDSSEVANAILQEYPDAPFAAAYYEADHEKQQVRFSLRSADDRMDVSEIAAHNGGGGHRNAAGFECIEGRKD